MSERKGLRKWIQSERARLLEEMRAEATVTEQPLTTADWQQRAQELERENDEWRMRVGIEHARAEALEAEVERLRQERDEALRVHTEVEKLNAHIIHRERARTEAAEAKLAQARKGFERIVSALQAPECEHACVGCGVERAGALETARALLRALEGP